MNKWKEYNKLSKDMISWAVLHEIDQKEVNIQMVIALHLKKLDHLNGKDMYFKNIILE